MYLLVPDTVNGLMGTSGSWALALLVVATVVAGINESCHAWSVRIKAFKTTSASRVIRSASSTGTQIGVGYFGVGAPGLVISGVLSHTLASLYLVRALLPTLSVYGTRVHWGRLKQLGNEYRDFPIYSASQNVLNALSAGMPVLLLTHFYGIAIAGAYAFSTRIIQTPMGLVLQALRQVLFQKASETHQSGGRLSPLYIKVTAILVALAIGPSLVLFLWAPTIVTWIFGPQWLTAGEFVRWLILWMAFAFCNLPAVLFAKIIRIQPTILAYDVILLVGRTAVLLIGGLYLSAGQSIMLFSVLSASMNLLLVVLVGNAVSRSDDQAELECV